MQFPPTLVSLSESQVVNFMPFVQPRELVVPPLYPPTFSLYLLAEFPILKLEYNTQFLVPAAFLRKMYNST